MGPLDIRLVPMKTELNNNFSYDMFMISPLKCKLFLKPCFHYSMIFNIDVKIWEPAGHSRDHCYCDYANVNQETWPAVPQNFPKMQKYIPLVWNVY